MTDATATAALAPVPQTGPTAVDTVPATPTKPSQTLDELMMAMDVVDTLRHSEKLVQAELSQGERDTELKARLKELYESQGLAVTDDILDQGIKALKESRFTYAPPAESWSLKLARLWVRRTVVGTWSAAALAALGLTWGGYYLGVVAPQRAAIERTKIEIADVLPRELEDAYVIVVNLAQTDDAKRQAGALLAEGRFALGRKDIDGARKAASDLEVLRKALNVEYKIRIVASNPSGIERTPDANERARNYYLIVQAITPDNKPLSLDITSEESGQTRKVEIWGVRVSASTYKAVGKDKTDNGIIENNIVGEKRRGTLKAEYTMPVESGAITEW